MTLHTPPQDGDDARLELAGEWQARLHDAPTDAALRTAFEAWLARDLRNRLAYADICAAAYALEQADPGQAARAGQALPDARRTGRSRGATWLGLAASLLVLAFAWQGTRPLDALRSDLRTAEGEVREFTLPDGSRATLAGDSALSLDFDGPRRTLALLRGEAYFDVQPDPARPFVVSAGGRTATAVGTRYAVSHRDRGVLVEVEEGRVAVAGGAAREPVLLQAGQALRDGAAAPVAMAAGALDWRRGLLVFDDVPLAQAAARLDAYIPGRVVVLGDPAARVSAAIAVADAAAALAAIAAREGLDVEAVPGIVMVVH